MRKVFALSFWICIMLIVNVALCFAAAQIVVNPTEKDYGDVEVGSSSSETFVVSNTGDTFLFVQSISLLGDNPGEFEIESGGENFFIFPGDDPHNIVVLFKPTSSGLKNAILSLDHNDPTEPEDPFEVDLSGTGIAAADIDVQPPEGDFGTVDIGEYKITNYADIIFEISNTGEAALNVTDISLTGTDAGEFSILSGDEPFSLNPEDPAHQIAVRFDPTTEGAKSANLTIVSNDPDESPLNVSLAGTGQVVDLTLPEIVGHSPQDGSILNIEPQDIQVLFDEPMDTESVLKNSEFVRINITDDVIEMSGSISTFLSWFGDPAKAAKYDSYGCQGPYGISPGESGMVDVTFNEDRDTLDIRIEDLTIGQPNQPITEDTEYRLTILINGATDDAGNTLALTHFDYTYFLTQQEDVTTGEQSLTLLHDESLMLNIPAGALSGDTTLTAYTHFYPADTLPAPLWSEFGKIGFIKAFHLELEESVSVTSPIEVQIQYDDTDLPPEADEESLRLYQRDEDKWVFLVGSSVDTDNNIVSYDGVTELGDFAVMWGAQYGDVLPDGVINDGDITVYILDIAQIRPIFAPAEGEPSDDSYMRDLAGNIYCPDIGPGDTINPSDTQEAIQFFVGILDNFTVFDPPCTAPMIASHSPSTHKVFLNNDILSNKVSIILDDATNIFAADVELTYDPRLLKISGVSKTSLSSDSFMEYNDRNPGKLRSVLVNGLSLNGSGSLIDIQFELMPGANNVAAFDSIKLTKVELNAGLVKATLEKLPQRLALLQNYPNPFNPETWIPYELDQTANVEVRIYNINGRLVRRLLLGLQTPGSYITRDKAVYWDGANDSGEKVSSGVYFYQLKAGEKSLVRKMVIMK